MFNRINYSKIVQRSIERNIDDSKIEDGVIKELSIEDLNNVIAFSLKDAFDKHIEGIKKYVDHTHR